MKTFTLKIKISTILLFLGIGTLFMGCDNNATLQRVDMYYEIVKTIILEPEVQMLLSEKQIESLVKIEKIYLMTSRVAKKAPSDKNMKNVLDCGLEAICVIDQVMNLSPKRKKELAAIRIGINVLLVSLGGDDNG